ncbi:hypothetical protein HDV62DRAFT_366636, partial [Trichoderma sp. SZMC 28011]
MGTVVYPTTWNLFLNGAAIEPTQDLNNCNMIPDCMVYTHSAIHYSFEKGPGFHSLELLDVIHRVESFRHDIEIAKGEDMLKMDYKKLEKSGNERDGRRHHHQLKQPNNQPIDSAPTLIISLFWHSDL